MGNVVILHHSDAYTLYAHLESILVPDGGFVAQGTPIGTVGSTGAGRVPGCPVTMPRHLHFEVKNSGALGDVNDDGPNWGYTPNHLNQHGYQDPMLRLHNATFLSSRRVRVSANGVNLRVGPGGAGSTLYRNIRQLNSGEQYAVLAGASPTVAPACAGGWYQLRQTDQPCSVQQACFVDAIEGGQVPDGWICADFVSSVE